VRLIAIVGWFGSLSATALAAVVVGVGHSLPARTAVSDPAAPGSEPTTEPSTAGPAPASPPGSQLSPEGGNRPERAAASKLAISRPAMLYVAGRLAGLGNASMGNQLASVISDSCTSMSPPA